MFGEMKQRSWNSAAIFDWYVVRPVTLTAEGLDQKWIAVDNFAQCAMHAKKCIEELHQE